MKIAKYTAFGALVGLCIGVVFSFFVGWKIVCNCTLDTLGCGHSTCADGCQEFISDSDVRACIIFFTVLCAVIGGTFGAIQTVQDNDADRKAAELEQSAFDEKQRAIRSSDVKQKALNLSNTCSKNKSDDKPLVTATYEANVQMAEIMNELVKVSEKQGKVDSVAEELSKKGGASV